MYNFPTTKILMSLETLRNILSRRHESDYIMPVWLPFLPLILIIFSIIPLIFFIIFAAYLWDPVNVLEPSNVASGITFLGFFAIFGMVALIGFIINIYVLFKWLSRRNDHFLRQLRSEQSIVDLVRKGSAVNKINIDDQIYSLSDIVRDAEVEERDKNAVLWLLLSFFVPFVSIYVYHFLTMDFFNHERREDRLIENLNRCFDKLGISSIGYRRMRTIQHRNTILYIILSIITLGLFAFYWVYVLTNDPNNHFIEQRQWEDNIVRAFELNLKE